MEGPDGRSYKILGDTLCAKINDCTAAVTKPYTLDEFKAINDTSGVPCIDGFDYNAVPLSQPNGKIFIVSKRDIKAGEEIFYSYSWQYWRPRVTLLHEEIVYEFVPYPADHGESYRLEPSDKQPYLKKRHAEQGGTLQVQALDSATIIEKAGINENIALKDSGRNYMDTEETRHMVFQVNEQ